LGRLAREKGLLVTTILHSPGMSAFAQFDDLLVMGKGGGVVYFGKRELAPAYFASIGFPIPPKSK
jgi:hypothetical protein